MDKRGQFEQKIKAKLEQLGAPDADDAWNNFSNKLHGTRLPIWRHWAMPYMYASLLFLGTLSWILISTPSKQSGQVPPLATQHKIDTLYRTDTVYIVDTIYLHKQLYINETNSFRSLPSLSTPKIDQNLAERDIEKQPVGEADQTSDLRRDGVGTPGQKTPPMAVDSIGADSLAQGADFSGTPKKSESTGTKPMGSNPSPLGSPSDEAVEESYFMRAQRETAVGDTSNLNQTPVPVRNRPAVHIELGTSPLFPISRLVEYYTPFQQTVGLGLEWKSGWGIYAGAIRNEVEGELDDEEIMSLGTDIIASLPDFPQNLLILDEIYFTNRQWFFPVELRWRSPYFNHFSFESNVGIVGNWLSRQNFTYEVQNNSVEEYQYATKGVRKFRLSHAKIGIGTNYLLRNRFGFFLRSHYWLPLSRTGLIKDRMHGIEVGAGVNIRLGR
ncbi:hypothetical protein ADIS_2627 [Lunatimonas lonarensis]|uniref:Outer membrane protein beta-barrel domain-containing protein n=1 Tax=Lunatimonas lonarensis TaxID=1232681 RepID=R7ZRV4_9BACT|nr:hypothetical protein [Lunatimonas lonarensis]EON76881.1 hypothetical protein ADIS_2627 [Lunatimonas lonarensis]